MWLIALSSVPLHLLYENAVFSTLYTPAYIAAVVSTDFLTGASFQPNLNIEDGNVQSLINLRDSLLSLQHLDKGDCLKAYRQDFIRIDEMSSPLPLLSAQTILY